MNGRVIVLNGTSSSGKTTIAQALRPKLDPTFCFYSSDLLAGSGFRPTESVSRFSGRSAFFHGFHRSVAAFASAGLDLLVEHIVEEQSWWDDLAGLLADFDVFWVGLNAPVEELDRRERLRGDRQLGEANFHLATHRFCKYHLQVDSTLPTDEAATLIASAWKSRRVGRRRDAAERPQA